MAFLARWLPRWPGAGAHGIHGEDEGGMVQPGEEGTEGELYCSLPHG